MKHRAGFTLVETLIALVLLGMIGLLGGNLVRAASLGWRRPPTVQIEHARILANLRGLIAHASPVWLDQGPGIPHINFDGTDSTLELLAPAPATLAPGGLARWRMVLRPTGRGEQRLEVSVLSIDQAAAVAPSVGLPHLAASAFAYYGRTAQASAPGWLREWRGQAALPELVRLHLEVLPGELGLSSDLVVHPLIQADASCLYSAITHRCAGR